MEQAHNESVLCAENEVAQRDAEDIRSTLAQYFVTKKMNCEMMRISALDYFF